MQVALIPSTWGLGYRSRGASGVGVGGVESMSVAADLSNRVTQPFIQCEPCGACAAVSSLTKNALLDNATRCQHATDRKFGGSPGLSAAQCCSVPCQDVDGPKRKSPGQLGQKKQNCPETVMEKPWNACYLPGSEITAWMAMNSYDKLSKITTC